MDPAPAGPGLIAELSAVARQVVAGESAGDPVVLSDRSGRLLLRFRDVVVKAHTGDTDVVELEARLRIASDPSLRDIVLAPLPIPGAAVAGMATLVGGRYVSAWPVGLPLRPDDLDEAPWEQAGALLAGLHAVPLRPGGRGHRAGQLPPAGEMGHARHTVPAAGVCQRFPRAAARLSGLDDPLARDVLHAYATLPRWALETPARPGGRFALIHGDWHLGQLLRFGGQGWRIIDIDDIGVGDPAWDLARPAAWFAAGLLAPEVWGRFLSGYQAAGGWAVPLGTDPWEVLEVPARAMAVMYAARAVADSVDRGEALDDVAQAFVECCRRMA